MYIGKLKMTSWTIVILSFCFSMVISENISHPQLDVNAWWGPAENLHHQDTSIRPFKIVFEEEMIEDLMYRIRNYRFSANPLDNTFRYGFNVNQLKKWLCYWTEKYSFTKRADYMNQYNHYLTNIQGLDIHFVNVPAKSTNTTVIPLLLLHGWASSFLEFYQAIPHLTAESRNKGFVFDLIIPSLPGFAYSDAAVRPGMGANEMAGVMRNLMHRLGYSKFGIYGGDWGSSIGASIATQYPKEVLGYYSSLPAVFTMQAFAMIAVGQVFPDLVVEKSKANRLYPLTTTLSHMLKESGYLHMQSTKPDTIGVALSDSPAGFLAYLLQVVSMVTRKNNDEKEDGGLLDHYTQDQLIDTVMVYWAPNKITTSSRIYAESFNKKSFEMKMDDYTTDVPTCIVQAPDEVLYMPPKILALKFTNILRVSVPNEGGHFLAMENPKAFAEDIVSAIQLFIDFHNNVKDVSNLNRCI